MRKTAGALAIVLAALTLSAGPASASVQITDVRAIALKDGGRIAVTWRTSAPAMGFVEYGPLLGRTLVASASEREHVEYGTDHLVVLSVPRFATYEIVVHSIGLDGSPAVADPVSVLARNGPSRFDEADGAYTANLLIRFDWDLTAEEMSRWEAHAEEFAVRVNDMSDGWIRLGTVVLADSHVRDVNWSQNCTASDCLSGADVVVFTGVGMSRYAGPRRVTVMWQQARIGGISSSGSAIEFPRWIDWGSQGIIEVGEQWWAGRRLAHEFGHYGMWLLDQYEGPVCANAAYDISIMNQDLWYSEIDSRDTPCDWQNGGARNSWDHLLRPAFPRIPSRIGPPDPGPLAPGSAFELVVLDRGL